MKLINKKDISSYLYVIMMIIVFLLSTNVVAQNFLKTEISIVEFNTSWNESNHFTGFDKIKNCKSFNISLCDNPKYLDQFKIEQPTIVLFYNGEEIKRYISTIMLNFKITHKNIQNDVDSLLLTKFN
tara:strand:+ start:2145 stop:2525 length:381 start_codon:yes stop_codon:yes gene_type:complete